MKKVDEAFAFLYENISSRVGNKDMLVRHLMQDLFNIYELNDETLLTEADWNSLRIAADKLNRGEPLQYVTGIAHFYGLQFKVNSSVLIPRPETEELVYEISRSIKNDLRSEICLLDIGAGSGCIALTLKKNFDQLRVVAMDRSADAIEVARQNAKRLDVEIEFIIDDILAPEELGIVEGRWHYIVSNPPYIRESERNKMDSHVVEFEPSEALFPVGATPLQMYECILAYSFDHLQPNGEFYIELNEYLACDIESIAEKVGFQKVRIIEDMQGKQRILSGTKVFSG